jgi:hypothetical protein
MTDFSERNPWTPVTPDTSLIDVVKKMVPEGHLYIRRVAVLDPRSASKYAFLSAAERLGLAAHNKWIWLGLAGIRCAV